MERSLRGLKHKKKTALTSEIGFGSCWGLPTGRRSDFTVDEDLLDELLEILVVEVMVAPFRDLISLKTVC